MKKGQISVIVPVYNGEQYLSACIRSILESTYQELELILVDDGSKDRSGEICQDFAKKDARVTVLEQENKGVSAARNAGLLAAQGEFLSFVDCDDQIHENAYTVLISHMEETVDVIQFGYRCLDEGGNVIRNVWPVPGVWKENLLEHYLFPRMPAGLWSKFYRRSCIWDEKEGQQILFREDIRVWEDWLFNCQYLNRCRKQALVLADTLYDYRIHSKGVSREAFSEKQMDIIKIYHEICTTCRMEKQTLENLQLAYCEILLRTLRKAYQVKPADHVLIRQLKTELLQQEKGYLESRKPQRKMKACMFGMHYFPKLTVRGIDRITERKGNLCRK